jgi:hypothetical protein
MQGIPEILVVENAWAVVAATGGVGEEDEFDRPVGENGIGERSPVGDKCLKVK